MDHQGARVAEGLKQPGPRREKQRAPGCPTSAPLAKTTPAPAVSSRPGGVTVISAAVPEVVAQRQGQCQGGRVYVCPSGIVGLAEDAGLLPSTVSGCRLAQEPQELLGRWVFGCSSWKDKGEDLAPNSLVAGRRWTPGGSSGEGPSETPCCLLETEDPGLEGA